MVVRGDEVRTLLPEVLRIPRVAREVLEGLRGQEAPARVIGRLLHASPRLHPTLVAFANRTRGAGGLTSVWQAVGQLGTGHACDVVLAASLRPHWSIFGHWPLAIATAGWARVVAAVRARGLRTAFLCGLFHAMGPHLAQSSPHERSRSRREGVAMAKAWGLPPEVSACLVHQRGFVRAPSFREEVATTQLARLLAAEVLGNAPADVVDQHPAVEFLGLEDAQLRVIRAQVALVRSSVAVLG